jgi:protein gp37
MIHWIVSGGESGSAARSISEAEFRKVKRLCDVAGIKWFMKQMGTAWARRHYGGEWRSDAAAKILAEWPEDLRVRQSPDPASAPGLNA